MPRYGSGELIGYGDLTGRSWARWRQLVDELTDDIAPMRDGDDARTASGMTQRPSVTFWRCKAKPSAMGDGRRRADVALAPLMVVSTLALAMLVARESILRGRRSA